MAKILVFGARGQLGQYLLETLSKQSHEVVGLHREHIDLTQTAGIAQYIDESIELVVNASAYTAVDKAESEEALAKLINADAPLAMAKACRKNDIPFIHFSTDYVFSGDAQQPYLESDATNPQGVYGSSKLAGELAVLQTGTKVYIFRTAWVYSQRGNNFYKTMLRLANDKNELGIVSDQIGSPTYAASIANATAAAAELLLNNSSTKLPETGVYHLTCSGKGSWYDFASAIFKGNKIDIKLNAISTADFPTPAKRPAYSVLNNDKLKHSFGIQLPSWQQALQECIAEGIAIDGSEEHNA